MNIRMSEVPEVRDALIVEDTFRYEGQWPEGEGVLYDIDRGMIFGHFPVLFHKGIGIILNLSKQLIICVLWDIR